VDWAFDKKTSCRHPAAIPRRFKIRPKKFKTTSDIPKKFIPLTTPIRFLKSAPFYPPSKLATTAMH